MDRKKLGKRIREERMQSGITQEQLAADIGVSTTYIGFVERGERSVTLEKLELLAERFHVPMDSLVRDSGENAALQNKEDRLHDLWGRMSADEKDMILSFAEFTVRR